jgi:hypothetical protein
MKLTTHLRLVPRWKNGWSCTFTPQYAFMTWCSGGAQGQLYLTLQFLSSWNNSRSRVLPKTMIVAHLVQHSTINSSGRPCALELLVYVYGSLDELLHPVFEASLLLLMTASMTSSSTVGTGNHYFIFPPYKKQSWLLDSTYSQSIWECFIWYTAEEMLEAVEGVTAPPPKLEAGDPLPYFYY